MKNKKPARSGRRQARIGSPTTAETRGSKSADSSTSVAIGEGVRDSGNSTGPGADEAATVPAPAMSPVASAADDRTREVDPNKAYVKFVKQARATLQALEGRERDVKGMDPGYAQEVETLERLEAMTHRLLVRMRAQKRDFDKSLRELRAMLDERDDFVATWME